MKNLVIKTIVSISIILFFYGCPSTVTKTEKPEILKPEITIQVASLNLSNLNKRIERKNLSEFVKIIKREQIEILSVQGISRYPGLTSRIDFVTELSKQMDWRNVFGEMMNVSGRQTGNAVFSTYPIISHFNQTFDVVKSDYFESGLHATIDAGVRSISVISAQLPVKATVIDQEKCLKMLTNSIDNSNKYIIITGNLPSIKKVNSSDLFVESIDLERNKDINTKIWYSAGTSFKLINSYIVDTELGGVVIGQLGIYK